MPLNKSKGNMYPWVSHTWNAVKGRCPHGCSYCYMKNPRYRLGDLRLDKRELGIRLGEDNIIFVGSSCDMWAEGVPGSWVLETLDHCHQFQNKYLYQSKNPARMLGFVDEQWIPPDSILATTIETNRRLGADIMGCAPGPEARADAMRELSKGFKTVVTVEPVMDFDVVDLWNLICECNPAWVNIGADSGGNDLPEPNSYKIRTLIYKLKGEGIEVKTKANLKRLL